MSTRPGPTVDTIRAAEYLAADILARRAAGWHPLTGDVRRGFYLAAMSRGYGRCGMGFDELNGYCSRGTVHMPSTTFGLAGWLVFCAEHLDHDEKRAA